MVLGTTKPVNIEDEMRRSYLDYAMSVIVSRALPDVRDGLKPVHRRILYVMREQGLTHNSAYKKSARIVGDVLGKYHPHGDTAVYDSMVRMAQDFSMRYPLIDGQGNFGSVDNDPAAAMRYTEARLSQFAEEMLADIDKETVDFTPNFDGSLQEPVVLPARVPNLLLNGASGIAVGMATNIPPHNLSEVCDALEYLIENPEATIDELTRYIAGPDFPTGGIIIGRQGISNAYATGHGKVVVRARTLVDEVPGGSGRRQIIVTELPYQTNKAALVERIAELVKDKKITGISDLRDESDRQGMRVVIELRRDGQPQKVLNNLYKYTAMQSSFFINMLALVDGQPKVISIKEALQHYIDSRQEVITRRSRFELKVAKSRAHILEGLKIALDNIDRVIAVIRQAENVEAARQTLMAEFGLSQEQAQAILDMQLRRLANLERQKILDEYAELLKNISYLEDLLENPRRILQLIKNEVAELKKKYGDDRRTQISDDGVTEFSEEDLIPHQRVVVTLSNRGFIKRVPAKSYRAQHRGGRGIIGMVTREEDAVKLLVVADTHDSLMFFTDRGRVFRIKCYEIPGESSRTAKGIAEVNLFPVAEGERVTAITAVSDYQPEVFFLMGTRLGEIKKTAVENFANVRSSGLIAMDLEPEDDLVGVCQATDQDEILMATQKGQSIRFPVANLRATSRTAGGVRGIRLEDGDKVVGLDVAIPDSFVLTVSTNGFGKLSPIRSYPRQHRGGYGVRTFKITDKTGEVAAVQVARFTEELMIISAGGIVIQTPVKEKDPRQGITIQGRSAQGVRLMRLDEGDQVVAITCFEKEKEAKKAEAEKEKENKKSAKTGKNQSKSGDKGKKKQSNDETGEADGAEASDEIEEEAGEGDETRGTGQADEDDETGQAEAADGEDEESD